MRALLIWCALGAGLIGLKVHLDRTATKYADVAVRAGNETYFIPRTIIRSNGWRADVQRLAGCWDAREAGLLPVAAPVARCGVEPMQLELPAVSLGADATTALRGKPLKATFWPAYAPPPEHLAQLAGAWSAKGEWVGRVVAMRGDWRLAMIVAPNTPWVHLLAAEPTRGTSAELASLYAGRCYRPEPLSDIGMTCEIVLRLGRAAIEFALGPDEIMSFATLRAAVETEATAWRRPTGQAANRRRAPSAARSSRR